MNALHPLMLGLGMLLPVDPGPVANLPTNDPARLRELLLDRQQPREQSQAALLLVQDRGTEAEAIVRQGLRQSDEPEIFIALAAALRLERDSRFTEELVTALVGARPLVRRAAADTLAATATDPLLFRLKAVVDDTNADSALRQDALLAIGHSGRKAAVPLLMEQLLNADPALARIAADSLAEQTGQSFGRDLERWRAWWDKHKDRPAEQWLDDRLAYQTSRARRLENELERAKSQLITLHQQFYQRLPAADRLGHVQNLADHEDPTVRGLAVAWSNELLASADSVGQRALAGILLRLSYDGNAGVQRAAVLALGRVPETRAFEQLQRLLREGTPTVRAAAAHALTQRAVAKTPAPGPDGQPVAPPAAEEIRQVVPLLQKALDDPALEVVVAAAENLGTLGVSEAGPVLSVLLRHHSESVRQTAAQALERVADPAVLDGVLAGLDDSSMAVRFGLVGALGRIAADPRRLTDPQRSRILTRLEDLLLRDPDVGVRSRAATVIGQTGAQVELPFLWRRLQAPQDGRVQEKTWAALMEIIARSGNLELVRQWDRTLADADQPARRLEMLGEICERWKKGEKTKPLGSELTEVLVQAMLEQGKWAQALPLVRELLDRPCEATELDRRLVLLLRVGDRAMQEGNRNEALRVVREAQPFLPRSNGMAAEFERLERRAKARP